MSARERERESVCVKAVSQYDVGASFRFVPFVLFRQRHITVFTI